MKKWSLRDEAIEPMDKMVKLFSPPKQRLATDDFPKGQKI